MVEEIIESDLRKRKLQEIRTKALAEKESGKQAQESNGAEDSEAFQDNSAKRIKFRNYQPRDGQLASSSKQKPTATESTASVDTATADGAVSRRQKVEQMDVIEYELMALESEEINIVPQKVNSDLKQQIAPKLEKLKRRTQKVIVEILRQKLAADSVD